MITFLDAAPLNPFWDKNFMDLVNGIKAEMTNNDLTTIARQIAAIFSLIYFAVKAYMLIAGEGRFEIMPLFRPFIICMVIINFNILTDALQLPANAIGNTLQTKYEADVAILNTDAAAKEAASDSLNSLLFSKIIPITDTLTAAQTGSTPSSSTLGRAWDIVSNPGVALSNLAASMAQLMFQRISYWLETLIEKVVTWLFKGLAYCIFFLQILLLAVLTCLGPISFAFSIAGPFRDSWVHWVGRYFAVTFYKDLALMVLALAFAIYDYGLRQETDRIHQLLASSSVTASFLKNFMHFSPSIGYVFIAAIVALGGIISVPVIATWIIQTAGTGNTFLSTGAQAATKAGSAAVSAGTKAVGTATSAAAALI